MAAIELCNNANYANEAAIHHQNTKNHLYQQQQQLLHSIRIALEFVYSSSSPSYSISLLAMQHAHTRARTHTHALTNTSSYKPKTM